MFHYDSIKKSLIFEWTQLLGTFNELSGGLTESCKYGDNKKNKTELEIIHHLKEQE